MLAKAGNKKRDRSYGLRVMSDLSEGEFQRMFRLSRAAFSKLVELVNPFLCRNELQAKRSSGSANSVVSKLAASEVVNVHGNARKCTYSVILLIPYGFRVRIPYG